MNLEGIEDHNGTQAGKLAKGYKNIDRVKLHPELFTFLEQAQTKGKQLNILDVGCGSGDDAFHMAKLGHKVTGVDPSDLLTIARREHGHKNIQYIQDTLPELTKLPKEEQFDVILMCAVLQYIDPNELEASFVTLSKLIQNNEKIYMLYQATPSREHQYQVELADIQEKLKPSQLKIAAEGKIQDPRKRKDVHGNDLYSQTLILSK